MPRRLRDVEGDEFGEFFKFDKLSAFIEGTFEKQRTTTSLEYGDQIVFDIKADDGKLYSIRGDWDLKSKMAKVPPGAYVRIEYVNNKDMPPNRDGSARNPMKIYRVQTDAEKDAAPAPKQKATGSDDDIPF